MIFFVSGSIPMKLWPDPEEKDEERARNTRARGLLLLMLDVSLFLVYVLLLYKGMIMENGARNTVSVFAPRARGTGRAPQAVAPGVPVAPAHAAPPEYVGAAKHHPEPLERRNARSIAARKYRAVSWCGFWPPGL
jgi:hypothetical protein